jgi:hypothetical protein
MWVKLDGWGGRVEARLVLVESIERYAAMAEKPKF